MINICHNCLYHEKCISYRYNNVRQSYMLEIEDKANKDGIIIIYVQKCSKYTGRKFKYRPNEISG